MLISPNHVDHRFIRVPLFAEIDIGPSRRQNAPPRIFDIQNFHIRWEDQLAERRLLPILLTLTVLGAFLAEGRIEDVLLAFGFGLLGLGMKRHGWPRVPLLVALVLASFFEVNLHLTTRLHEVGRIDFWTRPIPLVLLALTLGGLALSLLGSRRSGKGERHG